MPCTFDILYCSPFSIAETDFSRLQAATRDSVHIWKVSFLQLTSLSDLSSALKNFGYPLPDILHFANFEADDSGILSVMGDKRFALKELRDAIAQIYSQSQSGSASGFPELLYFDSCVGSVELFQDVAHRVICDSSTRVLGQAPHIFTQAFYSNLATCGDVAVAHHKAVNSTVPGLVTFGKKQSVTTTSITSVTANNNNSQPPTIDRSWERLGFLAMFAKIDEYLEDDEHMWKVYVKDYDWPFGIGKKMSCYDFLQKLHNFSFILPADMHKQRGANVNNLVEIFSCKQVQSIPDEDRSRGLRIVAKLEGWRLSTPFHQKPLLDRVRSLPPLSMS